MKEKPSRQLLDWVQWMLDEGIVKDFCWSDRVSGVFQVPWPHGSSSSWRKEHCKLFMLWAQHKGKLEDRETEYKKLKATFRCALNSRKDELKLVGKTKNYRYWQIRSRTQEKGQESKILSDKRIQPEISHKANRVKVKKEIKRNVAKKESSDFGVQMSGTQLFDLRETKDEYKLPSFDSLKTLLPPSPPSEENIWYPQEIKAQSYVLPCGIQRNQLQTFAFVKTEVTANSRFNLNPDENINALNPTDIMNILDLAENMNVLNPADNVNVLDPAKDINALIPQQTCIPEVAYVIDNDMTLEEFQMDYNPTPPPDLLLNDFSGDGGDVNDPLFNFCSTIQQFSNF